MKVQITKDEKDFSLTIESGHFTGKLKNISRESMVDLKNTLDEFLREENPRYEMVWNPRSQRLEKQVK